MDVVDKIKDVRTTDALDGAMGDVPIKDILIKSVRRAEK